MTIVGCKSTKFSGNNKEKEGKIYNFVQIPLRKAAIKQSVQLLAAKSKIDRFT